MNIVGCVLHGHTFRVFPVATTGQALCICFTFRMLGLSLTAIYLFKKKTKPLFEAKKILFSDRGSKCHVLKAAHSEFFLPTSGRTVSVTRAKTVCYSKFIRC